MVKPRAQISSPADRLQPEAGVVNAAVRLPLCMGIWSRLVTMLMTTDIY